MTNHILLRTSSSLLIMAILSGVFPAITNAQEMKPETLSERLAKIQPAQTQQINPARNWGVSEGDRNHAPKHGIVAWAKRHSVVLGLATGAAVGLTFALIERRGHCPGEYTSGDPPCPPPDKNFKH